VLPDQMSHATDDSQDRPRLCIQRARQWSLQEIVVFSNLVVDPPARSSANSQTASASSKCVAIECFSNGTCALTPVWLFLRPFVQKRA